jgi:signal transduction histidine kinase/DNA-binding response OmpR family regulator
MSAIDPPQSQTIARQSFEQILEQLYREYKRLEIEYRKLSEYKKLSEEFRRGEDARRAEAEERNTAEFARLRDDFGKLEAGYRELEAEYRKLIEQKRQQDEQRATQDEATRQLEAEYKSLIEQARRQDEQRAAQDEATRQLEAEYKSLIEQAKRRDEQGAAQDEAVRGLEAKYKNLLEEKRQQDEQRFAREEAARQREDKLRAALDEAMNRQARAPRDEAIRELEFKYKNLLEEKRQQDEQRFAQEEAARQREEKLRAALDEALGGQARAAQEAKSGEVKSPLMRNDVYKGFERGGRLQGQRGFYSDLLLESCPDSVLILDKELKVALATSNVINLVGVPDMESIVGQRFDRIFEQMLPSREVKELSRMYNDALATSKSAHFSRTFTLPEGGMMTMDGVVTPARDAEGAVHGLVIVMHDITELDAAKKHAEETSRTKSSFLATVSHEIRTPLNAVLGLSEIEMQKDLPRETMDNLEKIYNSGSSLLGIINDILDISKIEAGNMEIIPTTYTMSGLIGSALQLNLIRIGSKDIAFDLEMDPNMPERFYGDELRVKQILNNLLSNAFKYTAQGSVKLTVDWRQEGDTAVIAFTVSDTGQGIKSEDMDKLFSEYKQLNARANRYIEGTGLGLSITKKLAELMDGSISVESEFGVGSAFTVSITQDIVDLTPLGEDAIKNLKEFRFAEYKNKKKKNLIRSYMPYGKVLVVDDVVTNLEVARGLLLPYGLTIDCVASGAESVERVRGGEPFYDLVLMDHMMPDMDGIEATKLIREAGTDYAKTVPIIALTANAMAGMEEMFLTSGFDGYISKPIDIMRLDVELNKWIRNKRDDGASAKPSPQPPRPLAKSEPDGAVSSESYEPRLDARSGAYFPELSSLKLSGDMRVDGLDIQEGLSRYGESEIYAGVLHTFAESTPQLLNKMRIISRDKLPEYAVTVHGIKGSSYGICAATAAKWAERLELAAKREDLETILSENNDFIKMVERLIVSIDGVLGKPAKANGSGAPKAFAPDRKILERILLASKQFDLNSMEQYLMELEGIDYEYGGDVVKWLREQMDNLEYGAIQDRLSRALMASRKR